MRTLYFDARRWRQKSIQRQLREARELSELAEERESRHGANLVRKATDPDEPLIREPTRDPAVVTTRMSLIDIPPVDGSTAYL